MPTMPKKKANTINSSSSKSFGSTSMFKKSSSSSTLGTRTDTKLSQASLSSFFKARPPDTSAKEAPAIPASIIPTKPSTLHSTPIAKPAPTSVSLSALALLSERAVGAKAPRRIIIDDNDDEYLANSGSRAMSMLTTKPLKRFKAEKARVFTIQRTAAAISAVNDNALPFEDRMPVSPPDTSDPAAVQLSEQTENVDDLTNQKQIGPATQPIIIPDSSSQSGTTITTTPQKDITQRNSSVSQKSNEKSSPFRTPNEKSRRSSSTMESLGLSPQDSVFWVRTPPSEALKKLEAMSSGSSHEEEIASIVGRLYETSSAGAALRSMDKEPRDRIKDMLNTIRGSSIVLDPDLEDDLEDLERPDPKSPTKELVDRHKNMAAHRQGLVRHRSAHELGCAKERGGTTRPVSSSNLPFPAYMTSPSKRREDVLKMIEQINANIGEPSENGQDDSGGPSLSMRTLMGSRQSTGASTLFSGRRARVFDRPTASDSISGIPLQDRLPQPQSPPGEFDSFFTDLDMDDQDFAELTQLELSSTSMSSAGSNTTSVSCPSSSAGSCANRGFSHVHRELLDLDMESSASMINIRSTLQSSECAETTPLVNQARVASPRDDFDDLLDLGDDFDIEDDLGLSEFSSMPRKDSAKYRRFLVNEVSDGIIDSRWIGRCKVLEAQETKDSTHYRIFLRDSWSSSRIAPGNIVHVINALFFQLNTPELMVNDAQGFLIVRPDILIPTSVLAESFSCIRKPIVDIRTRKTDKTTVPLIHGTMLHELFQHSLQANNFSTAAMESCIDKIIKAHLNDLYLVNESIDIARDSISRLIPSCQDWARRYLRATPTSEGTFEDSIGVAISNRSDVLCVNKILDIEENIWSPMFGLKGKIDASIQVVVKTTKKTAGFEEIDMCTLTVPFELKTGRKSVIPHRAQTMLYTLLMTDRYDVDVRWGLLLYLKTGEFIRVPAPHDEIRTILMQRNEIAVFEEEMLTLPPMAKNAQKCERCFSFSSCSVLHKLLEDGNAESSGLGTRFDEVTDHLNGTHAAFLRHWNRLLTLEQGDVAMFQSQIWSMLSAERQAAGDCFSNLLLVEQLHSSEPRAKAVDDGVDDISLGRYGRYRYRFKIEAPLPSLSQQTLSQTLRGGNSLLSSNISVGDPIVVSSETQHYALAIGQVQDMSMSDVTVGLDRPLLGPPIRLDGYDQERNQSYRGLIDIVASSRSAASDFGSYHAYLQKFGTTFRIDKDEMAAGIARTRNNLVQLFRADADGGDSKRRRLVVDLERPIFEPVKVFQHNDLHLNDDQRHAIETVLTARDYALILGMPGTGKTTTIAQIIHTLVAQGKSVLLSSYTHSAVDNVLMKLRSDINVVRLGNKDRIHRDIRHLIPDFSQPPMNTVEAIHKFYGRCQVVGTTCLGIGDPLFTEKRFDYCIIDEASQITLPACLGPIRYADVFVLVGDHNQLPPLVKNAEAKKDGFDLSLFKILSDQYPEAVVSLKQQYRMNEDIMLLSNTLVYENQLECATEQVAHKVLDIPDMDNFRRHCHPENDLYVPDDNGTVRPPACSRFSLGNSCWLEQALNPSRSVIFIDTDDVPAYEVQVGNSTQNPTEALLVLQLTEALISGGISEQDIGVISVLRAQLKVLSRLIRARPLLDIHTVDRYQGKDKECVIVSLVRSNNGQHVGELLKDWRRINVAFTRAKRKLVVFGSRRTLQGSAVFGRFLQLMEQQKWVLRLAPQAQHQHPHLTYTAVTTKIASGPGKTEPKGKHAEALLAAMEEEENTDLSRDSECDSNSVGKENICHDVNVMNTNSSGRKGTKAVHAKTEVLLKRMPIIKNIIDGV